MGVRALLADLAWGALRSVRELPAGRRLGPRLGGSNLDFGNIFPIDPVEIRVAIEWALASVRLRVRHVPHNTHDDTVSVTRRLPSSASLTCVRPLR